MNIINALGTSINDEFLPEAVISEIHNFVDFQYGLCLTDDIGVQIGFSGARMLILTDADGHQYLVKLVGYRRNQKYFALEHNLLTYLEDQDFPAVRIIRDVHHRWLQVLSVGRYQYRFMVYTYIQGRILSKQEVCEWDLVRAANTLGRFITVVGSFSGDTRLTSLGEFFHAKVNSISSARNRLTRNYHLLSVYQQERLRELLNRIEGSETVFRLHIRKRSYSPHIVHGDMGPTNMIFDKTLVSLIDFYDIGYGDVDIEIGIIVSPKQTDFFLG